MKSMKTSLGKRALLATLIAGGGVLAATAYAMPEGKPASRPGCEARQEFRHDQGVQSRFDEMRKQHMATLKEKLKLKPGQEAAWNAFVAASEPGMRKAGMDGQGMRGEFAKLNMPERMDKMLAMADLRRAHMAERAEAVKTFYAQLTPEQQKVFDAEAMPQRHQASPHRRQQS